MEQTELSIDGEWRPGADGAVFEVVNKATEEVITVIASAEIADAGAALDAAERAKADWAARSPRECSNSWTSSRYPPSGRGRTCPT